MKTPRWSTSISSARITKPNTQKFLRFKAANGFADYRLSITRHLLFIVGLPLVGTIAIGAYSFISRLTNGNRYSISLALARKLHHAYKQWCSPLFGERCRFDPCCSDYAIEAIEKHGLPRGLLLGIWRVLRCNPYCLGGPDPVPEKTPKVRNSATPQALKDRGQTINLKLLATEAEK